MLSPAHYPLIDDIIVQQEEGHSCNCLCYSERQLSCAERSGESASFSRNRHDAAAVRLVARGGVW